MLLTTAKRAVAGKFSLDGDDAARVDREENIEEDELVGQECRCKGMRAKSPEYLRQAVHRRDNTGFPFGVSGVICQMEMLPALNNSRETVRPKDLRKALLLIHITLAWMVIEGASSILLGWVAGSLILIAFGLDSAVELFSASVLLWRLKSEAKGQPVESIERRASRLAGGALLALSAYVIASSVMGLIDHHTSDPSQSVWGIIIGVIAAIGMPVLAKFKLVLAAPDRLNSRALRADAMEAVTCGFLSWVMIAGLALTYAVNWWWVDSVAALGMVPLLIKEGLEAVRGRCCCCDK